MLGGGVGWQDGGLVHWRSFAGAGPTVLCKERKRANKKSEGGRRQGRNLIEEGGCPASGHVLFLEEKEIDGCRMGRGTFQPVKISEDETVTTERPYLTKAGSLQWKAEDRGRHTGRGRSFPSSLLRT